MVVNDEVLLHNISKFVISFWICCIGVETYFHVLIEFQLKMCVVTTIVNITKY